MLWLVHLAVGCVPSVHGFYTMTPRQSTSPIDEDGTLQVMHDSNAVLCTILKRLAQLQLFIKNEKWIILTIGGFVGLWQFYDGTFGRRSAECENIGKYRFDAKCLKNDMKLMYEFEHKSRT